MSAWLRPSAPLLPQRFLRGFRDLETVTPRRPSAARRKEIGTRNSPTREANVVTRPREADHNQSPPARRSAPYGEEPGYYEPAKLWLYGNVRLIRADLFHVEAHQRSAVVPLRWGSPRIVVMRRGFASHLGKDLRDEPFAAARLWRSRWDPSSDLAISTRNPESSSGFSVPAKRIDRIIRTLGMRDGRTAPCFEDPLSLRFLMPRRATHK